MTDPKTAARAVASRLSQNDIAIKHVQALDLVAAGCGYQDRSKLADLAALPVLRKVNIKLLTSAATVLARHDDIRRRTIIDTTTDVLVRTTEAPAPERERPMRTVMDALYPHLESMPTVVGRLAEACQPTGNVPVQCIIKIPTSELIWQ